jgi:DNA polymerase elongation subunit (family B)
MYHPKLAAAITYTSRATLNRLKGYCESIGLEVLYGHTDSVFVIAGHRGFVEDMTDVLNSKLSPIEVQFEKWCDRMLLMAKNRYAALVTWSDGKEHDGKLYIKGIEMKQSRMPPVMKNAMSDIIYGLLSNENEQTVTKNLKVTITNVVRGDIDPLSVCMKGRLDRNLYDYKVLSGTSAGAAWANEYLGKNYKRGSFFKVTLDENGKYIAFDDPKDIEGKYKIGYRLIAERFVIKKVTPYYEVAGWNTQPLYNSLNEIEHLVWL